MNTSSTLYGFENAFETREAFRYNANNAGIYVCNIYLSFIDYSKAFDRVQRQKMIEILRDIDLNDKDTNGGVHIERGVSQGCITYPLL